MQVKSARTCWLTPVTMAISEKTKGFCWRGCGEREHLCCAGNTNTTTVGKLVQEFLKMIKMKSPCDTADLY